MAQSSPATLSTWLQDHWWRTKPSAVARLLQPLSWVYAALAWAHRASCTAKAAPVPVLVVGNCVVGGAGKTPVVMAVVALLQAAGHRPAVLSRGYGRSSSDDRLVTNADTAHDAGDEPLLMHRRTGAAVWVGQDRLTLAQRACAFDATVDVLVCDDGLQHHRLARRVNLVVFDERGVGNGLLLPAGPLRQEIGGLGLNAKPVGINASNPNTAPATATRVVYNTSSSSPPLPQLPGTLLLRSPAKAWPLAAWQRGPSAAHAAQDLQQLRGQPLLAVAGLGHPEKFFAMLQATGLQVSRLPLPDHHPYTALPWPANTPAVITTEKDAIKLHGFDMGNTQVWVVPLDLALPEALGLELLDLLFAKHRLTKDRFATD